MIDIKQDRRNIFIETYGCQMNEYDSELVRSILTSAGYVLVDSEDEADVVMLNTCAVRDNANRKVYGRIHSIKHRRNGNPVTIGILGCIATHLRTDLLNDRHLNIDFIAGPDSYKRLPALIEEALVNTLHTTHDTRRKIFDITLSEFETYSDIYPARKEGVNAWIAVMRGCNNFCTFCVVPYTRGRERSRSHKNIVAEVEHLVRDGFKQVTLLGQNVNSYYCDGVDFAGLLDEISQVNGIERVRFTSPHPKDFPDRLIDVVTHNPKVCKHIHLPLQAGNDRILELMNRTYTQDEYLRLIDKIRAKCPEMALTADIIVGFPTETDAEFENTVKVMEKVEFDSAFIFKYSERRGTIAQKKYPDDVSEETKTQRIVRLNELQKEAAYAKNRAHIGQIQAVMIEAARSKKDGQLTVGRTDGNKVVTLPSDDYQVGQIIDVHIDDATPHALRGKEVTYVV